MQGFRRERPKQTKNCKNIKAKIIKRIKENLKKNLIITVLREDKN